VVSKLSVTYRAICQNMVIFTVAFSRAIHPVAAVFPRFKKVFFTIFTNSIHYQPLYHRS
jgi:hypothetical protein